MTAPDREGIDFAVLDASHPVERQRWLDHWRSWAGNEVQAHPAYVALFAGEDERALAAVARTPVGSVLFPFVLRPVPSSSEALTDLATPYGYGGPFSWDVVDCDSLARSFWESFARWSERAHVVCEFIRLSLFGETLLPYPGDVTVKQDNVVVDLTREPDVLWMSFEHKVRKNVNKARRSGIEVEVDTTGSRFDDFESIYSATMDRRGAGAGYYFGRAFFETIHRELAGQFAYFHAVHDGAVISTELVLLSERHAYSFLGGTLEESFALRPNDLLKFEIMRWASEQGRSSFVLGGGYEPDDGIFRYKRAFAPDGSRPFAVGTRILAEDAYLRMTEARAATRPAPDVSGYFPAYRA